MLESSYKKFLPTAPFEMLMNALPELHALYMRG